MLNQLHFLQPYWFLALIPLAIIWWVMVSSTVSDSKAWAKVIDAQLLSLLLSGSNKKHDSACYFGKSLLAIGWIIAIFALADPVWEKVPRPIFQTNSARVIVLDLSSSMLIADLKPSRLARARFKIEDILSENFTEKEEGQIGLVLFAGAAFTASPLTRDSETIRALLQVLTPRIMPTQGSRVDLGLKKAHELLIQAGVKNGQILLIADGVSDKKAALSVAKTIKKSGHTVSVLGVGTEAGGILPALKYRDGRDITVQLESDTLQAIAQNGGGNYHLISTNNSDLKKVLSSPLITDKPQEKSDEFNSQDWKSMGPLILLFLLPLAALAFRRGWLFTVFLTFVVLGVFQPQPVMAESTDEPQSQRLVESWNKLWRNKEQQADAALKNKEYNKINSLSNNPLMRGTANYKKEQYETAVEDFKQAEGADARYNEGNALAKMEKYKEAIEAYDEALKLQPDMEDAKKNKDAVEKIMKQKKKQKKEEHKKPDSNKDKKDGKQKKQDKNSNKDGKKNQKDGDKKEDGKNNKSDKNKEEKEGKDKKEGKPSGNQFSDANKKLDKKKNGEEKLPEEKGQEDNKKTDQNKEKKGEAKEDSSKVKKNKIKEGTKVEADELSKEEKMAAEQWLRRVPDDPGGLLRRKFQWQYQQRRKPTNDNTQPW